MPKKLTGKSEIDFEDLNAGFAERMQLNIQLYDPNWISTYRAHHRYVSQFRKGRCFLAGDAAHVHSPVGAQGMNTGLQDACNLGWKLALFINNQAKDILLSSYQEERLPFARQLVSTTDRAFGITVSNNGFVKMMRMYVAPYLFKGLVKIPWLAKYMFRRISQIGITYSGSLLTTNGSRGSFSTKAPKPGARLPFFVFEDESGDHINIQQLVRNKIELLLFRKPDTDSANFETFVKQYSEVSLTIIPFSPKTERLFKTFGIVGDGYYLVRPDLYIMYRCKGLETEHFLRFLSGFLQSIY